MDLEKVIIDEMSQQLANEMDQHILIGFMIELGWKEIIVDPWVHGNLEEILIWTNANVEGNKMYMGNRWVFEDEKDATMFALKWS